MSCGIQAPMANRPSNFGPPPATESMPGGSTIAPGDSTAVEPRPGGPAPVALRLVVSRQVGPGRFQAVAATHPRPAPASRDLRKVPSSPGKVRLHTGERVRLEVVADRDGHLTVFNVGPTGVLNLLYPDC